MSQIAKKLTIAFAGGLLAFSALTAAPLTASAETLTPAAVEALNRALADEYHAEAFYAAVIEAYGPVRPFTNIIEAERTHSAEVAALMEAYGIPVPENDQIGAEDIVSAVPASLAAACAAGVQAEIDNAALYDNDLLPSVASYPDITTVLTSLRDASQTKHLPAFTRCAQR
ncbi:DUF2202 domain-containing protein [Martelella alba]|uniref:DUF2202 domain-containing protein n=1 Tax=Martelella alba TaxID=2590451 RepID=A0A506U793_9HYPH|nr:DUF2202 domain-containing protein [Martelella alba]TPW29720.1 DUF2202 domain-containing protein [Martelella alba]